jgi:gas vesicle protein
MERRSGRGFLGFILGAATGAVLGILFAPKAGRHTREEIRDKANVISREVSAKVGEKMDEMKKYVQNLSGDVKSEVRHHKNVMDNKIENL